MRWLARALTCAPVAVRPPPTIAVPLRLPLAAAPWSSAVAAAQPNLPSSAESSSPSMGLASAPPAPKPLPKAPTPLSECGDVDDDEDDEMEDMFVRTSFDTIEWGGPLRGGRMPEPTRFGDWERKGRCTDF